MTFISGDTSGQKYNEKLEAIANGTYQLPFGCTYAPHPLAMTDEYAALLGQSASAGLVASRLGELIGEFSRSRAWWMKLSTDDSPRKDSEYVRAVYDRAARSLGPLIGELMDERRKHTQAAELAQERLIVMERDYNASHPSPESERWMKTAAEGIEL